MQPETTPVEIEYDHITGVDKPTDNARYTKLEQSEIRSRVYVNYAHTAAMFALAILAIIVTVLVAGIDTDKLTNKSSDIGVSDSGTVNNQTNSGSADPWQNPWQNITPYAAPTPRITPPVNLTSEPTTDVLHRVPQPAANTGTQITGYSRGCTAPRGRYLVYVEGLTANGNYRVQTDYDNYRVQEDNGNAQYRISTTGRADTNGNATFMWSCYTPTGMPMPDGVYTVLVTDDNTGYAATVKLTISIN